jgi:hypothetical protein
VSGLSSSMIKRVLFPPLDSVLEDNFYLLCSISYRRESRFNRIRFNRNEDRIMNAERTLE